jgi:hypothetical protein
MTAVLLCAVAVAALLGVFFLLIARDLGEKALAALERVMADALREEFAARRSREIHAQHLERVAQGRRGRE